MYRTFPKGELFRRTVKYVIQFVVIAVAALCLPDKCIANRCVISVALISASTFAVLDICYPATIHVRNQIS